MTEDKNGLVRKSRDEALIVVAQLEAPVSRG